VGGTRNGNLTRCAFHKLRACEFFDQIIVDFTGAHKVYAMFQTLAAGAKLIELLVLYAEASVDIGVSEHATLAPDSVIAEIGDDGAGHRWQDGNAKEACHATSDSHDLNESRTDSVGQGINCGSVALFSEDAPTGISGLIA